MKTKQDNANTIIQVKAVANVTWTSYVGLINRNFVRIKRWAKRSEHLKSKLISRRLWKIEVSTESHQCQIQGTVHGIKTCPISSEVKGIDYTLFCYAVGYW